MLNINILHTLAHHVWYPVVVGVLDVRDEAIESRSLAMSILRLTSRLGHKCSYIGSTDSTHKQI